MKLSYSVIKLLFINLHSFDIPIKDLIRKFLQDKPAIKSYIETLQHDIDVIGDDFETTHLHKSIKELNSLL